MEVIELPEVTPPKTWITENEARQIGKAAQRLVELRKARSARSSVGYVRFGAANDTNAPTLRLEKGDLEAVLGLLIERESIFLTNFDVMLDEAPQ